MIKKNKKIPEFANENEEREFWLTHDTTDYLDWTQSKTVIFPNLKPTSQSISLRLPVWMLDSIKITANRQDVPYQSLIKMWLNEKIEIQHHKTA
jgi:predicted DNA binding CopG/RHH family protein